MHRAGWGVVIAVGAMCVTLAGSGCSSSRRKPTPFQPLSTGSGVGAGGAGGGGGVGGAGGGGTRTLTQVIADGPWEVGQNATGIAVDADDRVYITDPNGVYEVEDGVISDHLTPTDVETITGTFFSGIHDLDIGPDGLIYVLSDAEIIQSQAAHQGVVFRDLDGSISLPRVMSMAAIDLVAVINFYDGLWTVTPSAVEFVYDDTVLQGVDNCAHLDLAVQDSGAFLYLPGCNGSPIVRGTLDGAGVVDFFEFVPNVTELENFLCAGRDPAGGFYVMRDFESGIRLLHVDEDFTETSGIDVVPTSPSFGVARDAFSSETLAFRYCSLAVGESGTVWVQTFSELWRIDP